MKTQTWSVLCHNKFMYQISSQYLKRLQEKSLENWSVTDRQTDGLTDTEQTKSPPASR